MFLGVAVLGNQVQQDLVASRIIRDVAFGQQLARVVDQGDVPRPLGPVDSAVDQGILPMAWVFALVTSACGPRSDLISGLGDKTGPPPHQPFVAPARHTGLGLDGSSQSSGISRGHHAAGSHRQRQRASKPGVVAITQARALRSSLFAQGFSSQASCRNPSDAHATTTTSTGAARRSMRRSQRTRFAGGVAAPYSNSPLERQGLCGLLRTN